MPPRINSRHTFSQGILDALDRTFLTDRVPYSYRELSDNRHHTVTEGDTLFTLAGHYFFPRERACGLWWVIADFQPTPVHDPTLKLEVGIIMVIPSLRTVDEYILSERRRDEVDST